MIEVVATNKLSAESRALKSAAVDVPAAGAMLPGYNLEIAGSVVASQGEVGHVEIRHGDLVLRTAPLSEQRTGVLTGLGLRSSEPVGFRTRVNLLGLPTSLTLRVVVNVGGECLDIAELVLEREPLRVSPPPPIHPLIVTTPGRTGSVWFSRLVGEHPAIVSYRPFELEPRMGSYWAYALRTLADPATVMQAFAPQTLRGYWWLGPEGVGAPLPRVEDPEIASWLAEDQPERVARFGLESASDFYARVAAMQQKPDAVYYVEKYHAEWVPLLLCELDTAAKEVFLVRDPRDQLASVVAWSAAGRARFSENAVTADQYIDWLAPQTRLLLRHWQSRSASSLLVRYEDLVLEPRPTLTRLFEYLGVDSSPETVAAVLESAGRSGRRQQRHHQTSNSPEQSVGRWRRDVSPELWGRMHEAFAPELEAWYGALG